MENIYYEPSPTIPGYARTQLRSELNRHTERLVEAAKNHCAADDSWLLEASLKLALCALALDAADTQAADEDYRALDPENPTTYSGNPADYERIRPLFTVERKQAQERWAAASPELHAALDSLRRAR